MGFQRKYFNSFIKAIWASNKLHRFKMYNLKSFDICVHPWKHHNNQGSEHTTTPWSLLRASLGHLTPHSSSLAFSSLGDHRSAFRTIFAFSRALYKWNHTVCTLCLASFAPHNYFEMNIWVFPGMGLEQTKLLWTFMYMSLCRHMFLFILGKYLVVEWLDHIISLYLTFQESAKLFPKVVDHYAPH